MNRFVRIWTPPLTVAAALVVCAAPVVVRAATIEASAGGTVAGVTAQDFQGPAVTGAVLANQPFSGGTALDLTGQADARAAQNVGGVSAVLVEGAFHSFEVHNLQAESRWTETVVNQTGRTITYAYQFFVVPPRLTIYENGPLGNQPTQCAWSIEVRMSNQVLFGSGASLTGSLKSHTLNGSGTPLGRTFFTVPAAHTFGYQFSRFDGFLSLGVTPPGGSVTVETVLRASMSAQGSGAGARAEVGDPLDLGSDPGIAGAIVEQESVALRSATWGSVKGLFR